jgi:seryl-tRNA synthetase
MEALKLTEQAESELMKQGYRRENLMYKLSQEEILELRLQRDTLSDEIEDIKEEKKEISRGFNDIIKSKENRRKPISRAIKTGYIEKELLVMPVANYDEGIMEYYGVDGVMLHDRPLKPSERQTTIMNAFKN